MKDKNAIQAPRVAPPGDGLMASRCPVCGSPMVAVTPPGRPTLPQAKS